MDDYTILSKATQKNGDFEGFRCSYTGKLPSVGDTLYYMDTFSISYNNKFIQILYVSISDQREQASNYFPNILASLKKIETTSLPETNNSVSYTHLDVYKRQEYGNAYWLISTLRGKIKALYLLDSRNMEIIIDDTSVLNKKNAVYYYYHDSKYGDEVYTSDEIVHFKNFALNGIEGKSIKKYLSDTINSEKMAREVIKEKYSSGLQDPIICLLYTSLRTDQNRRYDGETSRCCCACANRG